MSTSFTSCLMRISGGKLHTIRVFISISTPFYPFIGNEIAPEEYVAIVIDIGDVTVTLGSPPLDDSVTKVNRECVSMTKEEQKQMKYQPDVIRKAGFDTAVLPPTAVK